MESEQKRKKYKGLFFMLFLFALFLIPIGSRLAWVIQPKEQISILIVDKTVNSTQYNEHKSFNWILNYLKIVNQNNELYKPEYDYFGFKPVGQSYSKKFKIDDFEKLTLPQLDSIALTNDAIYFTDTYGVYANEWYYKKNISEYSRKLYGGLTNNEIKLLQAFKKHNKLILCEFNTYATPTSTKIRTEFEKTFDIKWSGWTCRFFEELDTLKNTEIPKWMIRNYTKQHAKKWNFKHSGLVYVNKDSRIFVLQNQLDLSIETPYIITNKTYKKEYNLPDSIHYPYWIDISYSGKSNNIIANYQLYTTARGDSILKRYMLPKRFPAIIMHNTDYQFYYFAGDFADNKVSTKSSYFKGITYFSSAFYNQNTQNRDAFFWEYYIPLITNIINKQKNQ